MHRQVSQRAIGPQAKLSINRPGDQFEQEADRVAAQVMRMSAPARIQRKLTGDSPARQESGGAEAHPAPSIVNDVIHSSGGRPLDATTRAFFEPRFGYDFAQIRVHTGKQAAASARVLNAMAYTVGNHIVFGAGWYASETGAGKRLLAHELTHVMQQSRNSKTDPPSQIQRENLPGTGSTCSLVDVFSELDPGVVLPSAYFRNGQTKQKANFNSELEKSKKGNCTTEAAFKDITLRWDLGNPNLKSWWSLDINKDKHTFKIINQIIYKHSPCCACFDGTLCWSFNVDATRVFDKGKSTERKETGKTSKPLVGSKESGACKGAECCPINKTFSMVLWLGDEEVSINFRGDVTLIGGIYDKKS